MVVLGRGVVSDERGTPAHCHAETGSRVSGFGFQVWSLESRVQGSGCRVWGLGFRVQGSGFRVQGSGSGARRPYTSMLTVRVLPALAAAISRSSPGPVWCVCECVCECECERVCESVGECKYVRV